MPILELDVVDLTMQLCAIDSVSGKEGEIVDLVTRGLEEAGWHVYRQKVGRLYCHAIVERCSCIFLLKTWE